MTRYSLDISDTEKRQIESCRSDLSWKELSFGAKLRVLIFEQVEMLEEENTKMIDLNRAANMAEMYAKACPGGINGSLNGAVIDIVDTAKMARYRMAEMFGMDPQDVPLESCIKVAIEALLKAQQDPAS
ncbi:hypothetical protein [Phormidium sp. FACHB-1136]|jgi:hypothetical protein|uniref:hypothetical protein n=1 Tax=Phormidium sp. FACHB-1136 TaxID=2692848 RepID=UPI00168A03FC|nr:hypothetical protein [Phormidium sp. FACHB-1136]MBD2426236.1 hypothetical protein [Phormidium sp. FACHB-1136]